MIWIILSFIAGGVVGFLFKTWLDGVILEGMRRE